MRSKAVVLLAVVFTSAGFAVGGDAQKELKKFAGTWSVVSAQKDGKDAPENEIKDIRFTFSGDKITFMHGDKTKEGTFKIDPSKKPKQIDVAIDGKDHPGIYKIKADRLEICVGEQDRPTEFKSADGARTMHIVLKREKK
jgi:uncharacterized protein (TIGR03067 family)